jgi:hypothetical protein
MWRGVACTASIASAISLLSVQRTHVPPTDGIGRWLVKAQRYTTSRPKDVRLPVCLYQVSATLDVVGMLHSSLSGGCMPACVLVGSSMVCLVGYVI